MLPDPIIINPANVGTGVFASGFDTGVNFARIPDQQGRSVRVGTFASLPATLMISTSSTKENKPYGTQRAVQRLEFTKLDDNELPVLGFVQITYGLPKAVVTLSELNAAKRALLLFALGGSDNTSNTIQMSAGDALVGRILNGEL